MRVALCLSAPQVYDLRPMAAAKNKGAAAPLFAVKAEALVQPALMRWLRCASASST